MKAPQPMTPEEAAEQAKYPFGNPSWEYCQYKKYDDPKDIELDSEEVSNRDLLVAILRSADSIFHELRSIRQAAEAK